MQRPGADPADMRAEDFLCDFCLRAWDGAFPMVEGHRGSLICGACLSAAYLACVRGGAGAVEDGVECVLCLERRDGVGWGGSAAGVSACARCVKQAAAGLDRDPDWSWRRPASGGG